MHLLGLLWPELPFFPFWNGVSTLKVQHPGSLQLGRELARGAALLWSTFPLASPWGYCWRQMLSAGAGSQTVVHERPVCQTHQNLCLAGQTIRTLLAIFKTLLNSFLACLFSLTEHL